MLLRVIDTSEALTALRVMLPGAVESLINVLYTSANISTDLILGDNERSIKVNGSWLGVIGAISRGEADIGLSMQVYQPEAAEVVDYLFVSSYDLRLSYMTAEQMIKDVGDVMQTFLSADCQVVFLTLFVFLVVWVFNIIANILLFKPDNVQVNGRPIKKILDNDWFTLYGLFLYLGSSRTPVFVCTRVLLQFYTFYVTIFICYVYADMKTSFLLTKPKFYRTVEDIAKDKTITPILLDTGTVSYLFENSENPYFKEVWRRVNTPPGKIHHELPMGKALDQIIDELASASSIFVGELSIIFVLARALCGINTSKQIRLSLFSEKMPGQIYAIPMNKKLDTDLKTLILKQYIRHSAIRSLEPVVKGIMGNEPRCARNVTDPIEDTLEMVVFDAILTTVKTWSLGIVIAFTIFIGELLFYAMRFCKISQTISPNLPLAVKIVTKEDAHSNNK